jgi:hypothetical protein
MSAILTAIDPGLSFTLPPDLEAHEPPEHRGLRRDQASSPSRQKLGVE